MKVLFDGTSMQSSPYAQFHGGGEYAKYVFSSALEAGYKFDVIFYGNLSVSADIEQLIGKHQLDALFVADKAELYSAIEQGGYDRFYSALPYEYDDYPCNAQLVGVIHGARKIEVLYTMRMARMEPSIKKKLVFALGAMFPFFGHMLQKRHIRKMGRLLSIRGAKFVTVSETTKGTLMNFFPNSQAKNMLVAYAPFKGGRLQASAGAKDFYLMVSANRYEKNVPMAIKAFDHLFSQGQLQGKHVVVTGCDEGAFYTKVKNPERFRFLPYVPIEELEVLFRDAYCMVYPSINEGFGYPPLRAMAYGVPVIASAATSMPEACGSAALFFPPASHDDLCSKILMIDTCPELYARLQSKGLERFKEVQGIIKAQLPGMLRYVFEK